MIIFTSNSQLGVFFHCLKHDCGELWLKENKYHKTHNKLQKLAMLFTLKPSYQICMILFQVKPRAYLTRSETRNDCF